jgi:hypothetical protein
MMKELELGSKMLVYVIHLTYLPTQEDFKELSECERQITYSANS